jgi:ABC-type sugar transport system permease subunit
MERKTVFPQRLLPYLLLAPQLLITAVFFFWPAAQAVWFSFLRQDAFGIRTSFVGFENFADRIVPRQRISNMTTVGVLKAAAKWRGPLSVETTTSARRMSALARPKGSAGSSARLATDRWAALATIDRASSRSPGPQ